MYPFELAAVYGIILLEMEGECYVSTRIKLVAMGLVWAYSALVAINRWRAWHWLVCLALALSWLGDALLAHYPPLARRVPDPFLAGMGAFAVAQIVYIVAFGTSLSGMPRLHARIPGMPIGSEILWSVLPIYVLVGILYWVWIGFRASKPPYLKAATLVYCLLLTIMAAYACSAAFTGVSIAWPLIVGGALFIVSDGLIAARLFDRLMLSEKRYDILVWATYLPAQILLMIGTSWLY